MVTIAFIWIFGFFKTLDGSIIVRDGNDSNKSELIGEKDHDVIIKWNVENVLQETSLKLFYNGETDNDLLAIMPYGTAITQDMPMSVWNKINKFKGKIKGICTIINTAGSCEVTISKLQYPLAGSFKFINLDRYKVYGRDEINLDVKGGPEHCGDQHFSQNTTVFLGKDIIGNITLCGKPQPQLQWLIDGEKINGTVDVSKKEEHQYSYSFKLLATEDLQGRNITYRAIGYKKREITGKTTLFVIMPLLGENINDALSFGAIIGIVISILIAVIIISIAILYYRGTIGNRKSGGTVIQEEGMRMREEHV